MQITPKQLKILRALQKDYFFSKINRYEMSKEVIALKIGVASPEAEYHLNCLESLELIEISSLSPKNTTYYRLSIKGKSYLETFKHNTRDKIIWNILVPLIISAIGTILTNALIN